mgnify:CR=1 FL=1
MAGRAPSDFLDQAFDGYVKRSPVSVDTDLTERILIGGYPEPRLRSTARRRRDWHIAYATALAERDVVEIADVNKPGHMSLLLEHLAVRSGQLLNLASIGLSLGVDAKTVDRWIGLFEKLFIVKRVRAWHRNDLKRLVRTPKVHFIDSGLAAALQGIDRLKIAKDRQTLGPLLETIVYGELRKASTMAQERTTITHYRDKDQDEVDFVLERSPGKVVRSPATSACSSRSHFIGQFERCREIGPTFIGRASQSCQSNPGIQRPHP